MRYFIVPYPGFQTLELQPLSLDDGWTEHTFPGEKNIRFHCEISRRQYLEKVGLILERIQQGEIYELNFCIGFHAKGVQFQIENAMEKLQTMTGAPYCGIWKQDRFIIVCASPERFIKKNGSILTTQPMKGTARRGGSEEEDALLCRQLMESPKERSELFMTVDVARNDLSRIAKRNSVKTEGLCEILTFPHIHQMISTISCVCRDNISTEEILKSVFPPASMTGAPKQRAMQLIEQYELGSRGFYSGCLGWIDEAGNFDTCVVIRSLVYDIITGNLSFHVGSAITAGCNPEKEWEECLLKANALLCSASTSLEQVIFHSEI